MTQRHIWRSAFSLLSVRLAAEQIVLALLVFLLFVVWLRVPDASGLDVCATVLLALLTIGIAGAGETTILLRLAKRVRTARLLLLGTLLLVICAALWVGWSAIIGTLRSSDFQRAGYYNSRLPQQLRYFFTFERILLWLGWLWTMLTWLGAGLLAAIMVCGVSSVRPGRAILSSLRSASYWLTLLLCALAAPAVTNAILGWTPGHGLRREAFSLAGRLISVVIADGVIVSLVLCVLVACCVRSDDETTTHSMPEGTPDLNHPRTVDIP